MNMKICLLRVKHMKVSKDISKDLKYDYSMIL